MKIAIASDHAGFCQKPAMVEYLKSLGHEVIDFGPQSADRVDYPDFADKVARCVAAGEADRGVLICGTGIGMALTADKVVGVRAAVIQSPLFAHLFPATSCACPAASRRSTSTRPSWTSSSRPSLAAAATPAASRRSCARTTPASAGWSARPLATVRQPDVEVTQHVP